MSEMKEKPIFKIEACCLICARGVPDGETVWCIEDQRGGYIKTYYCERFMLRDLGYDVAQV
jgi:hypothetical protein